MASGPTSDIPAYRRGLLRLGALVIAGGFVFPAARLVTGHGSSDHWAMTLILVAVAVVAANVKFSIGSGNTDVTPNTAAIVFAAVTCSPEQAMLVTIAGLLPNIASYRARGIVPNVQSAGLGGASALIVGTVIHLTGASFGRPGVALATGILCTAFWVVTDFSAYATWDLIETGSARAISRYFRTAGPIDVAMTATAVMIAAPFHEVPVVVGCVLGGYTLVVAAIYRITASEHRHRTQSEHLRDVFSRYVPESVADQLADADHEIELGGQTRDVSVLFCDIRGFTAWSEQHEASVVVQQLNVLLGSLTEAVMRHQGTLDKFTGDGLMAFWGAPLEQPDHAELACRAAADIHAALAACNELRAADGMAPFEIGVGIASGPAVIGNIGHKQRLDYTAIGDTVNLAARLEAATKELARATVVSESTAAALPPHVQADFVALAPVQVKGKRDPVAIRGGGPAAGRPSRDIAAA